MVKTVMRPREAMYPNPVVLVTCGKGDETNIITLAWVGTVCSQPKMISISVRPSRHSYHLLKANMEFVLNIPTLELLQAVKICGTKSGRDCNKWSETGLNADASIAVETPGIKECPVSLECQVKQTLDLGAHTMFLAEVLQVRMDENWKFKPSPLVYFSGDYYKLSEEAV
ncbi:MAG: flavin reductase family protein [Promethearchaeota archaeon]